MFKQVVSSEHIMSGSIVSLPAKIFAGMETGRCEKLAITAKHSVELEDEIIPSIIKIIIKSKEEDSINPWVKAVGAVRLI